MKIICIGRNYAEHIAELANEKPDEPVVFLKPSTAHHLNKDRWFYPDFSNQIHYECELVVKIAKNGKSILPKFAHQYIGNITLGIDFTARDLQNKLKSKGLPWEKAKAFDHSALVGDWINISPEELKNIEFRLEKNNEIVQRGFSNEMIYSIEEIICHVSSYFTLHTGDWIFTGTPSGVGEVKIGDHFCGFINDHKMFDFSIH